MLQHSMMKDADPAEYEDDEVCEHCGRGGLAADAAMEGEEVLEDEDEPDESKTKADFIEAIRKKGKR